MSDHTPVRGIGTAAPDAAGPPTATEAQGWTVLSYLVAGVLVWGLLGWLADYLIGSRFLLPIGIVLGAAGGVYLVIKRFGGVAPPRKGER